MSYAEKIGTYQGDCKVLLGKHLFFSNYIKEFAEDISGHVLDLGTGPQSCNGEFLKTDKVVRLDGCDVESEVVNSIPEDLYTKRFLFTFGRDKLPYEDSTLDAIVSSCVIQHLNSFEELEYGISDISRVLKAGGKFYLMFKAGSHSKTFTHFNTYYQEERTFRVFDPDLMIFPSFTLLSKEILLDDNWIPYTCLIFRKL